MSYINKNLMSNEKILIETELHWIIFLWPLLITFLIVYFMFHQHIMFILNYVAVALIIYFLGTTFTQYVTTEYVLTTSRTIMKRGWLFIRLWDMGYKNIESVQLQQSLFGRVFGYGNVIVNGIGGDSLVFSTIDGPAAFREKLFEILEQAKK